MEGYLEQFIALANGTKLSVLAAMIFANFILGLATSIYKKTFRLKAVGDFLVSRVLPYILGYFCVVFMAVVNPDWQAAVTYVWGIIVAALVGVILANLKEMGINIPNFLAGKKE